MAMYTKKILMLGRIEGRRRRGQQRMRRLDGITNSIDMGLGELHKWWWTGRPGVLQFMGLQRVGHDWATELNPFIFWLLHWNPCKWAKFASPKYLDVIISSWKQSKPKRLRKNFDHLPSCLKNWDRGPLPGTEWSEQSAEISAEYVQSMVSKT